MQKSTLLLAGLLVAAFGWEPAAAQTLDPGFAPPSVYAPGAVFSAVEQPDGKRVVVGQFSRVNGTPAFGITRFNPNGTLDAPFQQNVGSSTLAFRIRRQGNGQFFLTSLAIGQPITAGGIVRNEPLRLNADGTGDASFNVGAGAVSTSGAAFVDDVVQLPGGQVVVAGLFNQFGGTAANGIVRLTSTGAVDPGFNPGSGVGPNGEIFNVLPLPNGQLLIGGDFATYNGVARHGVARLNANGSLDAGFGQGLSATSEVYNMVLQPDGKILVAGLIVTPSGSSNGLGIGRLMPDGSLDPSFTPPASLPGFSVTSFSGEALQVQPDGKILFINSLNPATSGFGRVARLNANGTLDASFQPGTGPNAGLTSLTLLASGQVLVGGTFTEFSGIADRPLVLLNSTGTPDPTFAPVIQTQGSVAAIVRQADGKLLVGGDFSEVNGQAARRLARFNPNGTLDATYQPTNGADTVVDLALQPNGNLLVVNPTMVRRFLTTGAVDNAFAAPNLISSNLRRVLLQPDGRLLVGGTGAYNIGGRTGSPTLLRLQANGALDNSFAPNTTAAGRITNFQNMALQPDGKLLVAGTYLPTTTTTRLQTVVRLEPTGAVDPSFTGSSFAGTSPTSGLNALQVQPDGKVLVGGSFLAYNNVTRTGVARLNADGTLDTGFVPPSISGAVSTLLVQPNGRVLVGGFFTGTGLPANLARLLPTGQADATFAATAVPNNVVRALLVQPDGGIVAGGTFSAVAGQPYMALARITASNVLHVAAPRAVADRTAAWPVPAHSFLNVAPAPGAHPQSLDVLDVLGRPVLHRALTGAGTAVLDVTSLAAGSYLLRVTYQEGTVLRRLQVQ